MATFPQRRLRGFRALMWTIPVVFGLLSAFVGSCEQRAYAADPFTVSIDSVTTGQLPGQTGSTDKTVTISGQLTGLNPDDTVDSLTMALTVNGPIRTRSAISEALAKPDQISGESNAQTKAVQFTFGPIADQATTWSVEFSSNDVLGSLGNGVFALGIKATHPNEESSASATLLPWFPDETSLDPTQLSFVIPITTFDSSTQGVHTPSDSERDELERISSLVSIKPALAAQVSWLIDPSINEWLNSLDDDQARSLAGALGSLKGSRTSSPYGSADVDALSRDDLTNEINDVVDVTSAKSSIAYITNPDRFDPTSFRRNSLSDNFVPMISNQDLGVSPNSTMNSPIAINDQKVTAFDQAVSECFMSENSSEVELNQCVTSQVAMMTAEQPNRSRGVAIVTPANWATSTSALESLIASLSNQPWVKFASLAKLNDREVTQTLSYPKSPSAKLIPQKNIRVTRLLITQADALAEVIDNPEFVQTYKQLVARTFSTQWSNQATALQFGKANLKNLQSLADSIAIKTSPSITIGSEAAELPITVVNSSGYDVTVRVALTSTSPARFTPQTSDIISIKDGQKVTVTIPIEVYGAGRLSVAATLVSTNSKVIGTAENIVITPTAYTRFASAIVIGALGLLILLVALRFVRRQVNARKAAS